MAKIVFLLEEPSMKNVLEEVIPKVLPPSIEVTYVVHEGKGDLRRSIPKKLQGWRESGVSFVVLHDQDSNDCRELKRELIELANNSRYPDTLIKIVCTELESWFLGDFEALKNAYGVRDSQYKNKAKYRNPDSIRNAKEELKKIIPGYQQMAGSKQIARYMSVTENKSKSFAIFINGVQSMSEKILRS